MLEAVAALGVSWMGWEAAPWPEPAQCGPARAGCSSPTEGSGVSGCLQRRDTIADAAETVKNAAGSGGSQFLAPGSD